MCLISSIAPQEKLYCVSSFPWGDATPMVWELPGVHDAENGVWVTVPSTEISRPGGTLVKL